MSITSSQRPFRWVLLKHTDAPGDSTGIHFDLLLEDNEFCRTWRLSDIPLVDGPYVNSVHITPHKLYWLDVKKKVVSGNRGVATRVKQGIFFKPLPRKEKKFINLSLTWEDIESDLVIDKNGCKIFSKKL